MNSQKGIKVIDFDLTIKDFFKSVVAFLEQRKQRAKTKLDYDGIVENIRRVNVIASNPRVFSSYSARISKDIEPEFAGFAKTELDGRVLDNRKFLAFERALTAIDEYYNGFSLDKEKNLLMAIKRWKYEMSASMFKDFVFPFKSLESFASYSKQR